MNLEEIIISIIIVVASVWLAWHFMHSPRPKCSCACDGCKGARQGRGCAVSDE